MLLFQQWVFEIRLSRLSALLSTSPHPLIAIITRLICLCLARLSTARLRKPWSDQRCNNAARTAFLNQSQKPLFLNSLTYRNKHRYARRCCSNLLLVQTELAITYGAVCFLSFVRAITSVLSLSRWRFSYDAALPLSYVDRRCERQPFLRVDMSIRLALLNLNLYFSRPSEKQFNYGASRLVFKIA